MEKLCLSKTTYDSSLLLFSIRKIKLGKKLLQNENMHKLTACVFI